MNPAKLLYASISTHHTTARDGLTMYQVLLDDDITPYFSITGYDGGARVVCA
jgi:hypothetical protein